MEVHGGCNVPSPLGQDLLFPEGRSCLAQPAGRAHPPASSVLLTKVSKSFLPKENESLTLGGKSERGMTPCSDPQLWLSLTGRRGQSSGTQEPWESVSVKGARPKAQVTHLPCSRLSSGTGTGGAVPAQSPEA